MKGGQGLLFFSGSWEDSQAVTIAQVALSSCSERPRSNIQTLPDILAIAFCQVVSELKPTTRQNHDGYH